MKNVSREKIIAACAEAVRERTGLAVKTDLRELYFVPGFICDEKKEIIFGNAEDIAEIAREKIYNERLSFEVIVSVSAGELHNPPPGALFIDRHLRSDGLSPEDSTGLL